MKNSVSHHSSVFLLEIIINFLFFMIAVAICLRLFSKSHQMSVSSSQLTQSVTICNSVAQICQSCDDPYASLLQTYPDAVYLDGKFRLYMNASYNMCSKDDSYQYIVSADPIPKSDDTILITCCKRGDDDPLYKITVSVFHPKSPTDLTGGDIS